MQKERRRRDSGRRERGPGTTRRRAVILSIPVGAVALIVVVLVFFSPFAAPCIRLQSIPPGSGTPVFPPRSTMDFSSTWCSSTSPVYHVHVLLTIDVDNAAVPLFSSVGINSSYPGGYSCFLPLHTHDSSGTLHVESAWPYEYTLGDFFSEWSLSEATVYINSSFASQPVNYSGTSLFGLPMGGQHSLSLFVDGLLSTSGPQLDISELDNPPGPYPACLGETYGTGHTLSIVYQ